MTSTNIMYQLVAGAREDHPDINLKSQQDISIVIVGLHFGDLVPNVGAVSHSTLPVLLRLALITANTMCYHLLS
jgi:hypothetical protein